MRNVSKKNDQCSERAETSVPKLGMSNHKVLSRFYPRRVQRNSAFGSVTRYGLGACSWRNKHELVSCNHNVHSNMTILEQSSTGSSCQTHDRTWASSPRKQCVAELQEFLHLFFRRRHREECGGAFAFLGHSESQKDEEY